MGRKPGQWLFFVERSTKRLVAKITIQRDNAHTRIVTEADPAIWIVRQEHTQLAGATWEEVAEFPIGSVIVVADRKPKEPSQCSS